MRDLFFKLFEQSHFNTGIKITPFCVPHLVYLFLIVGFTVSMYFRYRNRPAEQKEKLLRGLVYAIMLSYLSDFFVQDFVYTDGMNTEKLPFHVCIVTAVLMPVAQFNRNGKKILEPVAVLATLAPMMYLGFPASVGEGEPWCYQTVQTMFFHGTQLAWGVLTLALGAVKPSFKTIWKPGLLLLGITLWAKFGNLIYGRNFFFLEEDCFFIGLVEKGIIPSWILMIANPLVFFSAVAALYGVCVGIRARSKKQLVSA